MDEIVRLDSREEAVLQKTAEKFVALHKGNTMKALKEMIVLNGRLQDQLDRISPPNECNPDRRY